MIKIETTFTSFDISSQQINTFSHYNYIFYKYMRENFSWFSSMSNDEYDKIKAILDSITTQQPKQYIEPYYKIYTYYLTKYTNIFHKNSTFIDLGSSPGGFIKFALDSGMKGHGITLKPQSSNNALSFKFDSDILIYGDLLDETFLQGLNEKISEKVDFINMGAVLYDKDHTNKLKHYNLFLNQMYIAKKFLKTNGSIMFILDIFFSYCNLIKVFNFFSERK
jgi:hypothetical protein